MSHSGKIKHICFEGKYKLSYFTCKKKVAYLHRVRQNGRKKKSETGIMLEFAAGSAGVYVGLISGTYCHFCDSGGLEGLLSHFLCVKTWLKSEKSDSSTVFWASDNRPTT